MKAPSGVASLIRLAMGAGWWIRLIEQGDVYTLALNTEDQWGNEIRVRLYYSKGKREPRIRAMRDSPIRGTKTLCHPVTGLPVSTVADVRSTIQTGFNNELERFFTMSSAPRLLRADEVTFRIKLHPCDLDVFEELSECYDSREDIQAMLDECGEWGWTDVEVVATWGQWSASDYLGGCSYGSEADFTGPSGSDYYADMKATALACLNDQIANAFRTFDSLMVSK